MSSDDIQYSTFSFSLVCL